MSLHSSSSVNGEGSTPKDPLYKRLDELRSKGLNAIAELLIPFKRVFKLYEFKNNYVI